MGCTSDGASTNRRLIKLHNSNTAGQLIYKTSNPFTTEKRDFFSFLIPHI